MARLRYETVSEYRINKKGAECFRSRSYEETRAKLAELQAKRPNCRYTIQSRHADRDQYGCYRTGWQGRIEWSPWSD